MPPENQADSSGQHDSPTRVVELVVNLDDTTGEVIGDATATLLNEGALDVWTTPIQMKKQRPGVMLSVLCPAEPPEVAQAMARRVLELTGSFGVRFRDWNRLVLDRQHVTVKTSYGEVAVKVGRLDGRVVVAQPEFDAARALARAADVPVRAVMDAARAASDGVFETQGGAS
ncbi:MAG: nickel insertion protein [Planctomycetota bacterium]